MSQTYCVSVIVPVYEVEAYLEECLNSLCRQTLQALEIVLVNDGSRDRSGVICRDYARNHTNIRLLDLPHRGVAAAEQAGLEFASGDYIGFVGADDHVSETMYEALWREAVRVDADVAECGYCCFWDDGRRVFHRKEKYRRRLAAHWYCLAGSGAEALLYEIGYAWRIHRRSFLVKHGFGFRQDILFAEDYHWHLAAPVLAERMVMIDECGYFYRQRSCGNQTNSDDAKLMDFYPAVLELDRMLAEAPEKVSWFAPWLKQMEIKTVLFLQDKMTLEHKREFMERFAGRWDRRWRRDLLAIRLFRRPDFSSIRNQLVLWILIVLRRAYARSVHSMNLKRAEGYDRLQRALSGGGVFRRLMGRK